MLINWVLIFIVSLAGLLVAARFLPMLPKGQDNFSNSHLL